MFKVQSLLLHFNVTNVFRSLCILTFIQYIILGLQQYDSFMLKRIISHTMIIYSTVMYYCSNLKS